MIAVTAATRAGTPVIGTATPGAIGAPIDAVANWTVPASNGGSAITGYLVTALLASNGTVVTSVTVAGATTTTATMVLPSTANIRFVVRALNGVGAGGNSASVQPAVTPR